jgi:iron complex transport system ATP-binding protein
MNMLDIQKLSVSYGQHLALRDVTVSVQGGEILAVIGPNGAGKTTLIRAVSGVQPIKEGEINIGGTNLSHLSASQRARRLAVVPQARDLPGSFTVYQSVLLGRTPYLGWLGQASALDHAKTRLALERTQLTPFADKLIFELSGGEQQRVLLARALAQSTPVLLLDEPTTFLDLQHQSNFLNLVRRLATQENLAVMMALHDLNLAGIYADRIALLVNGKLEALGSPDQVLTERNLAQVYEIPVHIIPHPEYGSPLVLPDGRNANVEHPANTQSARDPYS